eukprot:GHVS01044023.1.p1 GENE.GHVS01044023.1~~GHVS01044023.1.p1  ORF type:complete len:591 (+),score=100.63 GHVS01044023.1:292-2064(+)
MRDWTHTRNTNMAAGITKSSLITYINVVSTLVLISLGFLCFAFTASECYSHGKSLFAASGKQRVPPSERLAAYPVCDLTEPPHSMLGLPPSPSAQAVWVAYYSRLIVAEQQPKEVTLVKLYCASLAARRVLFQLDPVKYFLFEQFLFEHVELSNMQTPEEQEIASSRLTQSVEAGNEVDVLLLHPDVFDDNIVKALMTLGWEEMKFYESAMPLWVEWVEDEQAELEGRMDHMHREIEKIDEKIEKTANQQMRAQIWERLRAEARQRQQSVQLQISSAPTVAKTDDTTEVGEVVKGRETFFRRLGIREQLSSALSRLEVKREQMESGRREMEKINHLWNARRSEVMRKWERFVGGAFERVGRNKARKQGETWEEGMDWIAEKYRIDPQANQDVCEGYMLEMVLDINAVTRVNGRAWRLQNDKREGLMNGLGKRGDEKIEGVTRVTGASRIDASLLFMRDNFEVDIDWMDEMLQDVNSLDMDVDALVDELVEMNGETLFGEIMGAAGDNNLARVALEGLLAGVDEIVAEMVKATETLGMEDVNELAELMTGARESEGTEDSVSSAKSEDGVQGTAKSSAMSQEDRGAASVLM